MVRRDPAAAERLTRLLDHLDAWASGLGPADLATPTRRGASVGVVVDRLREARAAASALNPGDALRLEAAVVTDADALAAALPGGPPPVPRASLAAAVRTTLGVLAERHPGQVIEVRVPPWGAVQVGRPGVASVHRRGTPPNVVETDAATWLRLAAGTLAWADAVAAHAVSASGPHAQLGDLLPLA
nr:hypothetical protein [Propionibacterium sp.]